jgi:hypothetical protein
LVPIYEQNEVEFPQCLPVNVCPPPKILKQKKGYYLIYLVDYMIPIWHDFTQRLAKMIDMASILFVSGRDSEGCGDIILLRMIYVIHANIF